MRLYIKQKVFSWRDSFTVKDASGADRYYVEGKVFSWGKKLHVFNMEGQEAAYIAQKVWSWLPRYFVYRNGMEVACIKKEFTFLHPKYDLSGCGWRVEGSFWAHDYAIYAGNRRIAVVKKAWFTWGDSYELDIVDGWDEVLALSVVLTIDCVMASQAAAAASSAN